MKTIHINYPTPLKIYVHLEYIIPKWSTIEIPKGTVYFVDNVKYNVKKDMTYTVKSKLVGRKTLYKYTNIKNSTDTKLDLSNLDYEEIVKYIMDSHKQHQKKITKIIFSCYDPYEQSVKCIDPQLKYKKSKYGPLIKMSSIENHDGICYLDPKIYEHTYGLEMIKYNMKNIIQNNKLNQVTKVEFNNLCRIDKLHLPKLTHITCPSASSFCDIIFKFNQIHTLDLSLNYSDEKYTGMDCDDVGQIITSNLHTLNLITNSYYVDDMTVNILDLFINNATITDLSYCNHTTYKHRQNVYHLEKNKKLCQNIRSKVCELITNNTTLINLNIKSDVNQYNYDIIDALSYNTSITQLNLRSHNNFKDYATIEYNRESLINLVKLRHNNLPILLFDFTQCDVDLNDIFINQYYYAKNLGKLIDAMNRSNQHYIYDQYIENCEKYNQSLSEICQL